MPQHNFFLNFTVLLAILFSKQTTNRKKRKQMSFQQTNQTIHTLFSMKFNFKLLSFAALATVFVLALPACKSKKAAKMSDLIGNYVYAYTSGPISKAAAIRIKFTSPVAATMVGQAAMNGLLSFSPALKGTAVWEDNATLTFQPESQLEASTKYVGAVNMKKLFTNVPADAESFEFDFQAKPQTLDVSVKGLQCVDLNDISKQQLEGTVTTADVADGPSVEKTLTAALGSKNLSVRWEHAPDQQNHNFYVTEITRGNSDAKMSLAWDAKAIGSDAKGNSEYEVPSISNFKIIEAKVEQDNEQYISLNFSDPLLQNQTLEGLISIADYKGTMRYVVDKNFLRVYPSTRLSGQKSINVAAGIKNVAKKGMPNGGQWDLMFEDLKPAVRLVGRGVIMPNSNGLMFPFEAVHLNSVDVEIFKIFNNNIIQFLQSSNLDEKYSYEMERVGRIVLQKKVNLSEVGNGTTKIGWNRYALDLNKLIQADPNAIYQVRIGYRQSYSNYDCGKKTTDLTTANESFETDESGNPKSILGYYGGDGDYYGEGGEEGSDGQNNDPADPCSANYYNSSKFVKRNVLASNLGIIAKVGNDKSAFVAVTDLRTTDPVSGAKIDFYDYQQQLIKSVTTDGSGIANVQLEKVPFVATVTSSSDKGYVKMMDGNSLSLSRFDVGGEVVQRGLKGFIYGERGVWRPGDSLFLNFVLEDKGNTLPANFPISFEMSDPRGQVMHRWTTSSNVNNIYSIKTVTDASAPTGNYTAKVKVGGAIFTKNLLIETVKPNRLKLNLDFGKQELSAADASLPGKLTSNWMTGPAAAGLNAKVEVQLKSIPTKFENKHKDVVFDDPSRTFTSEPQTIFDGKLDDNGKANVTAKFETNGQAPGKMQANFKVRVFERGGDFSTDNFSMPYHAYNAYVGVDIPKNKYNDKQLEINKDNKIRFVAVDKNGNALKNATISVGLYKIQWRWWWDNNEDYVSNLNSKEHVGAVETATITTNGNGEAYWTVRPEQWGRYLVRASSPQSGHSAGDFFNAGYPWYDSEFEPDQQSRAAAAMLNFKANKEKYNVGENIELTIPTGEVGRCLVTIESGSKVIESRWIQAKAGENKISIAATEAMTPTVYAHVSLIQPHGQVKNDLPIRLYGVIPIHVEDANTRLQPIAEMPEVLEPEQTFTLKVREKSSKAMAYTVAIVDEGLLDLTRFKTPDAWSSFYAREALGVKTWDIYDYVLGAYGGDLERILSIGGDGINRKAGDNNRANRFKPVVTHLGPFFLEKGATASHKIKLPNYIGSVKTMIVACNKGAYGSFDKATPVRKPLMLLATLPRVLSPGDKLTLPVSIFALEDKVKNVMVKVEESSGLINIAGGNTQNLTFNKLGEQMSNFDIQVKDAIGVAKFKVVATGGGETASQDIEIEVRNPNPYATIVTEKVLQPGESWNTPFQPVGTWGTNKGTMEVSSIPPINLAKRLDYLLQYPHGCVEQTTSAAFPQLYVHKLMEISETQKNMASNNVRAAIDALRNFQNETGGFGYWPGDRSVNSWSNNYVGHFLL
ncbi:MAG: hypothetical protein RLZZ292_1318, partial [Bacteroidota bacterium]